jgi:hypothetical protein
LRECKKVSKPFSFLNGRINNTHKHYKKKLKKKKKKTLDAPTTNYRGGIVSLYYLSPPFPPPSRVTYASVLFELSFLTSNKFKGLKTMSIWNSLLQWQSFCQGTQTPSSPCWHHVNKGFKVMKGKKNGAICSRNTWKSTPIWFSNVRYNPPVTRVFNQTQGLCHTVIDCLTILH